MLQTLVLGVVLCTVPEVDVLGGAGQGAINRLIMKLGLLVVSSTSSVWYLAKTHA